jgi:hypothetical protein
MRYGLSLNFKIVYLRLKDVHGHCSRTPFLRMKTTYFLACALLMLTPLECFDCCFDVLINQKLLLVPDSLRFKRLCFSPTNMVYFHVL